MMLFFLLLAVHSITNLNAKNNYPGTEHFFKFGYRAGDHYLVDQFSEPDVKDDGYFTIDIPNEDHIPYFHVDYNKITVSTNGYISFGEQEFRETTPDPHFPFSNPGKEHSLTPLIAPYFSDLKVNKFFACLTYQLHHQKYCDYNDHHYDSEICYNSMSIFNRAKRYLKSQKKHFTPKKVLVVTWKYAQHYAAPDHESITFQVALATDDVNTYLFFLYGNEYFGFDEFHPTFVGFQGESYAAKYKHPFSTLDHYAHEHNAYKPYKLPYYSNRDIEGVWFYCVFTLVPPTETIPSINMAECPAELQAQVYYFCDSHKSGSHSVYYYQYGKHYTNFYVTCIEGHPTYCKSCAPTSTHTGDLFYSEKCDQCLYVRDRYNETCTVTPPTLPPPTPTEAPFDECSVEAVTDICYGNPVGSYPAPGNDKIWYHCYGYNIDYHHNVWGTCMGPCAGPLVYDKCYKICNWAWAAC